MPRRAGAVVGPAEARSVAGEVDDLRPLMRQVLDAFGPSRLLWGSDCPYQLGSATDTATADAQEEQPQSLLQLAGEAKLSGALCVGLLVSCAQTGGDNSIEIGSAPGRDRV